MLEFRTQCESWKGGTGCEEGTVQMDVQTCWWTKEVEGRKAQCLWVGPDVPYSLKEKNHS
jgi:hypothetical protein